MFNIDPEKRVVGRQSFPFGARSLFRRKLAVKLGGWVGCQNSTPGKSSAAWDGAKTLSRMVDTLPSSTGEFTGFLRHQEYKPPKRMTKKWTTIIFCHMKDEGFDVEMFQNPKC